MEKDINQIAINIVGVTTQEEEKNSAAVALGKLGGKKGGPAHAAKLTHEQRKEIAKKLLKLDRKRKAKRIKYTSLEPHCR